MNFSKSIFSIAFTSLLFVSCKEAPSGSAANGQILDASSEKKEIVAAIKPETATFRIEGMSCAIGCAKTIEKKLAEMNGVQKAAVDFDKKEARVYFDKTQQNKMSLSKIVASCADGATYKVID